MAIVTAMTAIAVVAGALIPANRGWRAPAAGVTIYVTSNGVHTGLILPATNPQIDWRQLVRAGDLPDPRYAGNWLLFGWGERDFYLNTPTWADVSVRRVARALIGSNHTLVHVDHLQGVKADADTRPLVLTTAQYAALARAIRADFASQPEVLRGYGPNDVFYAARGRYSGLHSCNAWTGERLRAIGVRVGIWTPTAWSVMRWFSAPRNGEDFGTVSPPPRRFPPTPLRRLP